MKRLVKTLLHHGGFDVRRCTALNCAERRRMRMLQREQVNVVVDVGANVGQYACALRDTGFRGRIISLEPQMSAFTELQRRAVNDPLWSCRQIALAAADGEALLHVSKNSVSSSLLPMSEYMANTFPEAASVAVETVRQTTLTSIWNEFNLAKDRVFLKIDTQGYEEHVLQGAEFGRLNVRAIEIELALRPMYRGGSSLTGINRFLSERGFRMTSLEPNTIDPLTDEIVEVNAIFAYAG